MYKCKHFGIKELVPPETYEALGEYKCWWLFDAGMLMALDRLREDLVAAGICESLVINNWQWAGGNQKYSGYRPEGCAVGAEHSQHRYGRAFDGKPDGKWDRGKADRVRKFIEDNADRYPEITCLELDINWVHIDGRNIDQFLKFAP